MSQSTKRSVRRGWAPVNACLYAVLIFTNVCAAADTIMIPHSTAHYRVDGRLDDAIWKEAALVPLGYETEPAENLAATVRTDALVVETGKHLLIAFRAFDPEPKRIRAFLRDRDSAYDDDRAGIVLDSFNDGQRAFHFFVNPLGAQIDAIQDDRVKTEDDSWNATWEGDGKITSSGFQIEMAIPLNALRFRQGVEKQIWGIDFVRYRPRKHLERYANVPRDRNRNCEICQLAKFEGVSKMHKGTNIEVVPFILANRDESRALPEQTNWQGESDTEVGLDFRWGISPASTLNLSVNPDFSQIEADDALLDVNTTFSLFFPERRPFFLDSADYFETFVDAVHTRNISAPEVGIKYTSKSGPSTFGLIYADDQDTTFLLPRFDGSDVVSLEGKSQNVITRYHHDLDESSTVGLINTIKTGENYKNFLSGIDGLYRFGKNNEFKFQYLYSDTDNPAALTREANEPLPEHQADQAYRARYNFNSRNWFSYIEHSEFGKNFRADLGFINKVDHQFSLLGVGHVWHGDKHSWWNRIQLNGDVDITHRTDGQLLENEKEMYLSAHGPLQSFLEVGAISREQYFEGARYDQQLRSFYGEFTLNAYYKMGLWIQRGDGIDYIDNRAGEFVNVEPWIRWNFSRQTLARFNGRYQTFTLNNQELFNAFTLDVRVTYQFSIRSYLRVTWQTTQIDRAVGAYSNPDDLSRDSRFRNREVIYSYKFTPQTAFYLGYSDGGFSDDVQIELENNRRSVFLKYSYAWIPD